jgi:serine/threonine-protein kinase
LALDDDLDLPRDLGEYTLLKRLAVGGMAEVYVAKTKGIGGFEKQVAVKVIHPRYSEDEHFIQMLVEEAKISVLLTHVNIAQTFDLGRHAEQYYIVMEYIEGADAYRVMRKSAEQKRAMPIDVVTYAVAEMCNGLDYAHRKRATDGSPLNIVHRDISPQNVLVSFSGEVKLVDFGIAKAASRSEQTEAGVIKGKYYYMSPEQAWGDPMDHRSDIFSTGVVLYELLTGRMLYTDDNIVVLLDKVRKADIAPPEKRRPSIPKELSDIVMKALAKSPDDRYQSAQELAQALSNFLYNANPTFSAARLGELMGQLFPDQAQRHSNASILPPAREPTPTPKPAPKMTASADMSGWGDDEDDATRHDVLPFRRLSAAADDAARRNKALGLPDLPPGVKSPLAQRLPPADLAAPRPANRPVGRDPGKATEPIVAPRIEAPSTDRNLNKEGPTATDERAREADWEDPTFLRGRTADDFDDSTMVESGGALKEARALLAGKVVDSGRGRVHVNAPPRPAKPASVPPPPRAGAWNARAPSIAPPASRPLPPAIARTEPVAPPRPPAPPGHGSPTVPLAVPPVSQENTALLEAGAETAEPTGPFASNSPYQQSPASPYTQSPASPYAQRALPTAPFGVPSRMPPPPSVPWPEQAQPAWSQPPAGADPFAPPPAMPTQAPPAQEELGRPQPLRILGGLALLVILAVMSAVAVAWLMPEPPPPALAIVTNPAGATVLLDGSPLPGVTPLLVSSGLVEGQSYTLGVRLEGYSDWDATIVARPGTTTQEITLGTAAARLHVETVPPGAAVSINGAPMGGAPLDVTSLFMGQQIVLRATMTGYAPAQTAVRLTQREETITITLTPTP